MLRLKNVTKNYQVAGGEIEVLKGLNVSFRKSEFVSVLGPSGCGKTTTLNIVGGLDKYTSGDLIIAGKSTKNFNDRDWDTYRNNRIGFVFQNYNLIPHQTVLGNVELALTISGVGKEERVKRALNALERVGLKGEEYKRPNQLSGGQCQRVAIARALVNEPDILLADEPTGALDSKTSVQIMELIKEISKDKLVIMVTHNAEIADKYSTRIVRLIDGQITEDTNPYSEEDEIREVEMEKKAKEKSPKKKKERKAKMSRWTAFKLSLRNLFTKRGRTMLTSFAGSIGIIGISLILAVSQGTTAYINHVQENTLSSYPLTIEEETVDMTSLMQSFMNVGGKETEHDKDAIYKDPIIAEMVEALSKVETNDNDLKAFKSFIETEMAKEGSDLSKAISGVKYSYDLEFNVYTENVDGEIIKSDTQELMMDMLGRFMLGISSNGGGSAGSGGTGSNSGSQSGTFMQSMMTGTGMWEELLSSPDGAVINDLVFDQYDLIYGSWPTEYNEVVLVVNDKNEIDDLTLYALGLIGEDEIDAIIDAAIAGEPLENTGNNRWTYEQVCGRNFRTILPYNCYVLPEGSDHYIDMSEYNIDLLYADGLDLKVKGIIRENPDSESHMLRGSIAYTYKLTEHIINEAEHANVVKAQLASPDIDVLTGLPFSSTTGKLTTAEKASAFTEYVQKLSVENKAQKFVEIQCIMPQDLLMTQTGQVMASTYPDRASQEALLVSTISAQMGVDENQIKYYVEGMEDAEVQNMATGIVMMGIQAEYARAQVAIYAGELATNPSGLAGQLDALVSASNEQTLASFYDNVTEFSNSTYEDNLKKLGYFDLDSPSGISIYASSFENKDLIVSAISAYNEGKEETEKIKYTDYVGLLMSSITTIIDAITYVLIAFVAISLIVSSIMIGVITLISVQERTKEIGILRSIGASKKDVSSMFNAETLIIGLTSGLTGVLITYLLCIPINIILRALTGIAYLSAILPLGAAGILVLISMLLTLVSGIIPSRSAAKKDPVVALRTE